MAYLLDTHTFLWFAAGDEQLPDPIKKLISDLNTICFISSVSMWEITIKKQLGKLQLNLSLQELYNFAERNQIELIHINATHLDTLMELPNYHRDPFDRLIISQAISENLTIISKDEGFKQYDTNILW